MLKDRLRYLLIGSIGSLLLQLLAGQMGMPGMLLFFLVPVPIGYASMRGGMLIGIGSALLACVTVLFLGGGSAMLVFALQFALPALLMAGLLRQGLAWDRAILYGTLGMVFLGAGIVLVYSVKTDQGILSLVDQYVQGEVSAALSLAEQGELTLEQAAEFRSVVEQMGDFLQGTFVAWGALVTGLMMSLQVLFLKRLAQGHYLIAGRPLTGWKAPEFLIWPLILAGFGALFASNMLQLVALNLLVLLLPIYFLQGLAVVSFFFCQKGIPVFLRGLGYLLIAILNPLPIIVTGIGVFDMWADFRKPRLKKTD